MTTGATLERVIRRLYTVRGNAKPRLTTEEQMTVAGECDLAIKELQELLAKLD